MSPARPVNRRAANEASVKSRRAKSDEVTEAIAAVLLSDPAYRDLSHRALADLLNRRDIRTGWGREWTEAGLRRQRVAAEKLIREREALEAELDAEEQEMGGRMSSSDEAHVATDDAAYPDREKPAVGTADDEEAQLKDLPGFGMF